MRSVDSLNLFCKGFKPPTRASNADYGFDPVIYKLLDQTSPCEEQKKQLFITYKFFLKNINNSKNLLHQAYLQKNIPELLKEYGDFSWIRTTEHLKK
jgi:hypothetical protein